MVLNRVIAACFLMVLPALAQPGRGGPSLTHIHVNSADPDAAISFWTGVLGTSTYSQGEQRGVSMLGGVILFSKSAVSGPSAGSAILHIGLRVPDVQLFLAKTAKTPFKSKTLSTPEGDTLLIEGPDGVQIELAENSDMYTSLDFGHVHLQSPKVAEMQAWYAKYLGARPGADELSSRLGGAAVVFSAAETVVPTRGRAIDHLTLETRDLAGLRQALEGGGTSVDASKAPAIWFTDPWGTRIEVTQAPAQ